MFKIGTTTLFEFNITEIKKEVDFAIKEMVNDMTFINQSDGYDLYINNTQIVPGQEFNIGGNYREINFQNYNCRFVSNGAPVSKKCIILLKTYKNVV
jgi:hypothetical protein